MRSKSTCRLAAGESWSGGYVLRYREHYWEAPVFDRQGLQPMPPVDLEEADEDEDEED